MGHVMAYIVGGGVRFIALQIINCICLFTYSFSCVSHLLAYVYDEI